MGRKVKLTCLPCPVCTVIFKPERKEQQFCSRMCWFKARSERALKNHLSKVEKRCCGCAEVKPMHCFSKNKATKDGYQATCKSCRKNEDMDRLRNVRLDSERSRVYRAANVRIARRFRAKQYALRSNATIDEWLHNMSHGKVDKIRKYESDDAMKDHHNYLNRMRYRNDLTYREKVKSYQASRHKQVPWVMLTRKHRRDARMAGVVDDGSVSVEVMKVLWIKTKLCIYCGRHLTDFNKSVEHMHPMSKGGAHTIGNVVIVCAACNEKKREKYFDQWVELIDEPFRSMAHDRFIMQFSGSCPVIDYSG